MTAREWPYRPERRARSVGDVRSRLGSITAGFTALPPDLDPETCSHDCPTGIGGHLSWCEWCLGDVRYRDDCGEYDGAKEALDKLGVRIVPDHSQRSESDQWRLVAADLAGYASDDELTQVRERHEQRVGTVPDYDPRECPGGPNGYADAVTWVDESEGHAEPPPDAKDGDRWLRPGCTYTRCSGDWIPARH